jgi:hypothetical protein
LASFNSPASLSSSGDFEIGSSQLLADIAITYTCPSARTNGG